jgi:hypothetical protein
VEWDASDYNRACDLAWADQYTSGRMVFEEAYNQLEASEVERGVEEFRNARGVDFRRVSPFALTGLTIDRGSIWLYSV